MCGIFGMFDPGGVDPRRVVEATNRMRHRGPDDEGYLFATADGVATPAGGDETIPSLGLRGWREIAGAARPNWALGFRRLAIQDLSEAGHQPMSTPDGKLWMAFNGEVYNFPELRAELEAEGVAFRSSGDSEVVLRAYERWGDGCLARFNGMWGLAVLDLRGGEPELFLARDRFGIKPIFFARIGGGFAFASELKSLLALGGPWRPDRIAVGNYLAWGRLPSQAAGHTFVEGIEALPPGHCGTLRGGSFTARRYWDLPAPVRPGPAADEAEAVAETRRLLEDSVSLRLRADVEVGSCLSGGLDSSVIVGLVSQLRAKVPGAPQQHTFSAIYHEEGPFNEKEHIDKVLASLDAKGTYTLPTAARLVDDFDQLVWHQDEPFPTTSMFAQWCVMGAAKEEGVTVLLDGQAADELLGGYRPYRYYFQDLIRAGKIGTAVREAAALRKESLDPVLKELLGAALVAAVPDPLVRALTRRSYLAKLRGRAAPVVPGPLIDAVADRVRDPGAHEAWPWRRVTDNFETHLAGLVSDHVLPTLLRYEDRNSMAFSIESRVPYTDWRFVEHALSPALRGMKFRHGWSKWVLREAGKGLAPDAILWRRDKMGFGTPEDRFIQALAAAAASSPGGWDCNPDYIDPDRSRELIEAVASGAERDKHRQLACFRALTLQRWLDTFELH